MAKRKRLTPPAPEALVSGVEAAPETKSVFPRYPLGVAPSATTRAPIADVVGSAAAVAALSEVSAELQAARQEGRLVQALPLDSVDEGHLVRDRLLGSVAEDEMQILMTSLRARGQQSPIEVTQTQNGQYGLISGWRRLTVLRRLYAETGDERFARVHALIRTPDTAQAAYVAMVEENEIRVGLSYFERARIVARAVEGGICRTEKEALNTLFGSASRAKRSKIKSFIPIVSCLGDALSFPTAIGERLGLELAARLNDTAFASRLRGRLRKAAPESPEAETALLQRVLASTSEPVAKATHGLKQSRPAVEVQKGEELAPGLWLYRDGSGLHLSGPGLDDSIVGCIRAALVR